LIHGSSGERLIARSNSEIARSTDVRTSPLARRYSAAASPSAGPEAVSTGGGSPIASSTADAALLATPNGSVSGPARLPSQRLSPEVTSISLMLSADPGAPPAPAPGPDVGPLVSSVASTTASAARALPTPLAPPPRATSRLASSTDRTAIVPCAPTRSATSAASASPTSVGSPLVPNGSTTIAPVPDRAPDRAPDPGMEAPDGRGDRA
jgi:hypothetical protein